MNNIKKMKTKHGDLTSDFTILRPPVSTSVIGFLEIMKAYTNGTDEIRNLLSYECDIIYECKICRNIFRSLTNFISHKRVFCNTKFDKNCHFHFPTKDFNDEDCIIIETPANAVNVNKTQNKNPGKDLTEVIENLKRKQQIIHKEKQNILQLDNVDSSKIAVYQTVKYTQSDNIKQEMNEIYKQEIIRKDLNNLDENGQIIHLNKRIQQKSFQCDICKMDFDTEKMLGLHIQTNHTSSTNVYKCPSCSVTFLQNSSVLRHLSSVHHKSLRRIRTLRDSIQKKHIPRDEIKIKPTVVKEVPIVNIIENEKCSFCGKIIRGKTVLATHLLNCPVKIKQEEKIPKESNIKSKLNLKPLPNAIVNDEITVVNRCKSTQLLETITIKDESKEVEKDIPTLKRSNRNRVQKNHKDFVYDLPNTSTSYFNLDIKPPKRRNTIADTENVNESERIVTNIETTTTKTVKGAALLMANSVVQKSKAAFKNEVKISSNENEPEIIVPTIIHTRRRSIRKSLQLDSVNNIDNGVIRLEINSGFKGIGENEDETYVKCATEKEFQQYLETNKLTDPVKKIMLIPSDMMPEQ